MKYGIIQSKTIICDPVNYSAEYFRDIITRHGGLPDNVPDLAPVAPVECGPLRILPGVEILTQPPHLQAYQKQLSAWTIDNNQMVREAVWQILPDDQIRQNLKQALADIRKQHETGGITLAGGIQIRTDRESQAQLSGAYNSLKNGLINSTRWKSDTRFITVTLAELQPIAQAVAVHVSQSFSAEKAVSDLIDNAADTDALLAIDLQHEFSQAFNND
ncbi:DUF4376 domain-containing protein [Oceanospirillum sediminis]|uniref:DUF4376 domain-containing protein n=1 Tax=Oceanospirillum sediminis TaxID=2760088 RepID=A0A839IN35_9GAMM|nr:DUF4376 domain-containing protein [Oceanospirillum sediminis]MBB1485922.1 DUF4376 domain-containing protein [Oceanospirillum sediminis]